MRAVIQSGYGAPEDVLHVVDDLDRPKPKEDEVLVKVHASTITRGEAMGVRFTEYRFTRLAVGLRRPRRPIRGMEFAGRIEEAGPAVSGFTVGDEVFGIDNSTCAEYTAVRASRAIAHKPSTLSLEESTAVPDGSLLALTCMKPAYPLEGKNVLVYGAAGSVGTAAIQLLTQHFNAAHVTAVCDTKDVELVKGLGAHEVIDRFNEDFTKNGKTYDVIFDAVGKHSFRLCRQSLKPRGIYVSMDLGYGYHLLLFGPITKLFGRNARDDRRRPLSQRGPVGAHDGPDRSGKVPAGDRPHVPDGRVRSGGDLRRVWPEDRQRRDPYSAVINAPRCEGPFLSHPPGWIARSKAIGRLAWRNVIPAVWRCSTLSVARYGGSCLPTAPTSGVVSIAQRCRGAATARLLRAGYTTRAVTWRGALGAAGS